MSKLQKCNVLIVFAAYGGNLYDMALYSFPGYAQYLTTHKTPEDKFDTRLALC